MGPQLDHGFLKHGDVAKHYLNGPLGNIIRNDPLYMKVFIFDVALNFRGEGTHQFIKTRVFN